MTLAGTVTVLLVVIAAATAGYLLIALIAPDRF
ncbi:potassium-transporting ATPase subunit F [Gordonia alkaliphila]|nr:potassium-transporting ATPase subunit F [Gordonia alkaliphila]MCK0439368.1 potassium-transporting ATPase subunit F [Gordonia alkaliphila]